MSETTTIAEALAGARKQVRDLARALGIAERDIREAIEAHMSIESAPHRVVERVPAVAPVGMLTRLTAVPKPQPVRSPSYLAAVRTLPCKRCGITGHSDAAHPNTGKGFGTKADDNRAFPLCRTRPKDGVIGCHALFDQHGIYKKDERRDIEVVWGRQTYDHLRREGRVPRGMPAPKWED